METLSSDLPDSLQDGIRALLQEACDRGLALATAESCTGGMLASVLTDVQGCSHAFERGYVTYTDAAKREVLGLSARILEEDGAVSRAAALAMAEGALERSSADVALAITGYAGPSGDDGEEGLVHLACARRGGPTLHREAHFGAVGRGRIRIACIEAAVEMMKEAL